jgi:serine/threonine-protein kinase
VGQERGGEHGGAIDAAAAALAADLIARGQTARAALLYAERGDHAQASRLLEEACDFVGAAREALAAGDARRAVQLGALGGDEAICLKAIAALAAAEDRGPARRAAGDLSARGLSGYAGALLAAIGEHAEAAEAFAAAGDARRAAVSFDRAGRPADGARALEGALRRRPDDEDARLHLGRLLARHGRTEAAVRALQKLAPEGLARRQGLPLLARCLAELGLEDAAKSAREEMAALGIKEGDPELEMEAAAEARIAGAATGAAARAPAAADPQAGVLLFGRYESVREVASTPHARVVEAIDRVTSDRVAIKIFAGSGGDAGRDALLRFEREARALAQLRHPNVVPLHAYLPEGPAMALAWMAGGSLADRLREPPVAPARAVEIASSVLSALGEAHRLGILHRDVKPTNVLFDAVGTAYLSDFGAAHLGDLSSTATAGAIGTFSYMSPEQRIGRPASMASDLYGVGAVLYELLTGEQASPASGGLLDLPPSARNPELTGAHDAALARLLDEDPAARPADAFEARRALGAIPWPSRPPAWTSAPARAPSDRPPKSLRSRLAPPESTADGRDAARRRHDTWVHRDVIVLPLDERSLALARAFARAGHAALPTVLRADAAEQQIWVAAPLGRSLLDEPRPLSPGQLARLREAVAALHAADGAHGHIDREHLYWLDGEVALAYPRVDPPPNALELDREALAKLDG